jgi:hypothetical protein
METKDHSPLRSLKVAVAAVGSLAFFVASLLVGWSARGYQVSGQPMPNGKGGFMTFRDGYLIALVLFLFSLGWFIGARRFWRSR